MRQFLEGNVQEHTAEQKQCPQATVTGASYSSPQMSQRNEPSRDLRPGAFTDEGKSVGSCTSIRYILAQSGLKEHSLSASDKGAVVAPWLVLARVRRACHRTVLITHHIDHMTVTLARRAHLANTWRPPKLGFSLLQLLRV